MAFDNVKYTRLSEFPLGPGYVMSMRLQEESMMSFQYSLGWKFLEVRCCRTREIYRSQGLSFTSPLVPSYFYRSLCGITTNSLSLLGAGMMSWRVLGEFQGICPFFMSVFAKASCTTKNGHHWKNYAASTMASLFERGSSSTLHGGKPHR